MSRIELIQPENAQGQAKELIDGVQANIGMVPNIFKHMANSPAVLKGYLEFSGALKEGALSPQLREKIALIVGETNHCQYCVSAHTAIGKGAGLSEEEMVQTRKLESNDPKTEAAITFSKKMVDKKGFASDADVEGLKKAGFNDGEIAEIIANIALNIFTNYFNHVVEPDIDFPKVELLSSTPV